MGAILSASLGPSFAAMGCSALAKSTADSGAAIKIKIGFGFDRISYCLAATGVSCQISRLGANCQRIPLSMQRSLQASLLVKITFPSLRTASTTAIVTEMLEIASTKTSFVAE